MKSQNLNVFIIINYPIPRYIYKHFVCSYTEIFIHRLYFQYNNQLNIMLYAFVFKTEAVGTEFDNW